MLYHFTDVKALAEATMKATEFRVPYEGDKTTKDISFWLVKDQGVYVMPSFKMPEGQTPSGEGLVFYAEGHNPDKDAVEDWWVGGDDYAETIPLNKEMLAKLASGGDLKIKITQSYIEVIT